MDDEHLSLAVSYLNAQTFGKHYMYWDEGMNIDCLVTVVDMVRLGELLRVEDSEATAYSEWCARVTPEECFL